MNHRELVIESVKNFNKLTPNLSMFATSLYGKPLTVKAGVKTMTNGRDVHIKPPIECAYKPEHDYISCDQRDDTGTLICVGCNRIERIFYLLYHELGHCIYGSFNYIESSELEHILSILTQKYNDQEVRNTISFFGETGSLSSIVHKKSQVLAYICNFFEDRRIESKIAYARQGFSDMIYYSGKSILENGVDGTFWKDQEDDKALPAAWLFSVNGNDITGHFSDEVCSAVNSYIDKCPKFVVKNDSMSSFEYSLEFMLFMRTLGYYKIFRNDQSNDNNDENSNDESNLKELVQCDDIMSNNEDDESSEDGELDDIIIQVEFYDEVDSTGKIGKPIFNNKKKLINRYRDHKGINGTGVEVIDKKASGPALLHARKIFSQTKLDKNTHGLKKGKLDSKTLGSRAWADDGRIFKKKIRAQGINSEVLIGLDFSSSTTFTYDDFNVKIIDNIKVIASLTGNILNACGIPFSMFIHNTSNTGGVSQVVSTVKDINDQWDTNSKKILKLYTAGGGSLDGHNLQIYRKKLQKSKAKRKVLIYFTDGDIPATITDIEEPLVTIEVKKLKDAGIVMLGVGLRTDSPKRVGMDTIVVKSSSEISTVLKEIEKRIEKANG